MKMTGNWGAAGAVSLAALCASPAPAVDDVFVSGNLHVNVGIEAGAYFAAVENPNFGLGRIDLRTGENTGDSQHGETYLEPSVSFTYDPSETFGLFGEASAVFTTTLGEGDAGGFTDGTDGDIDPEKYSLGFRKTLGGGDNPWVFEASGGRQDVQIGDGWLIWDGNFDAFENAAYWLAPRTAFRWAGTADLSNGSIGIKPFYIQGDGDQDHSEMVGADLRLEGDWGKLGALYGNIIASDDLVFTRDGMQLVSLRALGINVPGVDGLSLSGEYTKQFGEENGADFDAHAFYGQADYTFGSLPWTPTLTYRYARFSGDGNPEGGDNGTFDPLFYGFSSGWGTWFQGEIVGEYFLFNSNQRNHMVKLSFAPTDSLGIGAIYYHFALDEKNFFGTPVSDRTFADEINLYADWTVSDNVYVSAVAGVAFPGKGAEQAFGDDENVWLFETYLVITF
jgi:hypothetical protein